MKAILLVSVLALLGLGLGAPGSQPYRVAFDLTSRDSLDQKAVLRWIKEVNSATPKAEEVVVVMYGKGIELVVPGRSAFTAGVEEAMKSGNVSFKVCAIAMKNNNVESDQILPGVQIVPDGIRELVLKQQDDWGYIKVSH
jgi:uncharacterized protein